MLSPLMKALLLYGIIEVLLPPHACCTAMVSSGGLFLISVCGLALHVLSINFALLLENKQMMLGPAEMLVLL